MWLKFYNLDKYSSLFSQLTYREFNEMDIGILMRYHSIPKREAFRIEKRIKVLKKRLPRLLKMRENDNYSITNYVTLNEVIAKLINMPNNYPEGSYLGKSSLLLLIMSLIMYIHSSSPLSNLLLIISLTMSTFSIISFISFVCNIIL